MSKTFINHDDTPEQIIHFSVTGDSLIVKRLCKNALPFLELKNLLTSSDVSLTNLETSLHRHENDIYPSRTSGGEWVCSVPEILEDLKWLGFNLYSIPNNHSMDWTHNGLMRTIENLNRAHVAFAGAGRNLSEATAPVYLETPGGRVALIACTTSFEPWHMAGEQRKDCLGRPGVFGLEFERIINISSSELSVLENIHARISKDDDGWIDDNGLKLFRFGNCLYKLGSGAEITRVCKHSKDLLKISIEEARRQADVVVVSIHSHERKSDNPHIPADFQTDLAHFCIDNGAHAFLAHGPHVIRGIEVYHGHPIIHGLGNFFYQCELLEKAPAEFYSKFASFDSDARMADVYDYRVQNGGILGETNPDYFQSVIITFSLQDGLLKTLRAFPVSLQFNSPRSNKGTPRLAHDEYAEQILIQLQKLSKAFGTYFEIKNGFAELTLV